MKALLSICLAILFAINGSAQERHFMLIQSDNKQLFNVSLGGKLYSANLSGYVIVPKLADGEYNIVIGFPPNTFTDQPFKCVIDKKDIGFELKNMGEKGWALFNLQSLDLTMAGGSTAGKVAPPPTGDEPISFDKKPAKVVVIPEPVATDNTVKTTEPIVAETPVAPTTDTAEATTNNIIKLGEEKGTYGTNLTYADADGASVDTISLTIPSKEKKKAKKQSDKEADVAEAGTAPVSDTNATSPETVAGTVAVDTVSTAVVSKEKRKKSKQKKAEQTPEAITTAPIADANVATSSNEVVPNVVAADTSPHAISPKEKKKKRKHLSAQDSLTEARIAMLNERKDNVQFLEIDANAPKADTIIRVPVTLVTPTESNTTAPTESPKTVEAPATAVAPPVLQAGDIPADSVSAPATTKRSKAETELCNSVATENDYIRLRRKMALENTDERMIKEAKKVYREKCFTTRQIKGLSSLFLSDEGRYKFFTASYSFVSDPAAYSALQSEFIDPFYVNRFKSIIQ